eukprot:TRINITY_DN5168_c2_g1_i1.p1 TRINITY_DN5168_c2_g1~~TRINITY_DN5168_c2_g1_i1.p1  ORF type:complete len:272 (+),score=67.91 TRINITY_DN5168_c2_g1_i1:62-817(+)
MNLNDVRYKTSGVSKLEFMAQEDIVGVVPNFQMDESEFISGRYGPFSPGDPVDVPLWLAMLLRESGRCKIETPEWMTKENLENILQQEKDEPGFQPLPFHYFETMTLICKWRSDVKHCTEVERLVIEIDHIRDEKIKRGIAGLKGNTYGYKMTSLTALEINTARAPITHLMDTMSQFAKTGVLPLLPGDLYAHEEREEVDDEDDENLQASTGHEEQQPAQEPPEAAPEHDNIPPQPPSPPKQQQKRRRLRR